MTDGLEVIAPAERKLRFADRDLIVKPLTVGQLPAIVRALKGLQMSGDIDVLELIDKHADQVIEAAAVAVKLTREEIEAGSVDEFMELVSTIVEVNSDFFVQRVAPQMAAAMQRAAATLGRGPTRSKP